MERYIKLITLCLSGIFFIASCSVVEKFKQEKPKWTAVEQTDQIVWADDDSEVAIVILHFEEKSGDWLSGTTEKRYFKHQIFTQKINDKEKFPLTELRDHQVGQVFFMKSAAYLITESILPGGARRFDKIDLKGHEILIIETPDSVHQPCQTQQNSPPVETEPTTPIPPVVYHTVIPSPDGGQLAHVYSPECGKASVEFLDAESLTVLDNQTFDIDEPMEVTWHRDGYIVFTTSKRDKAWKVKAKESPLPVLPPKCLSPVTTSSNVSAEGRLVYFDESNQLTTREIGRKEAFGCQ